MVTGCGQRRFGNGDVVSRCCAVGPSINGLPVHERQRHHGLADTGGNLGRGVRRAHGLAEITEAIDDVLPSRCDVAASESPQPHPVAPVLERRDSDAQHQDQAERRQCPPCPAGEGEPGVDRRVGITAPKDRGRKFQFLQKASEDLPDPLRPVITTNLFRGRDREIFLRLCSLAPLMVINSMVINYFWKWIGELPRSQEK